MTINLIVLSHPCEHSFNSAWADASSRYSEDLGITVLQSDLYRLDFDPVEKAAHYRLPMQSRFDPLKEQEAAADAGNLPPDVELELGKLRAADRVIFHFPLWWFGPPAMLKGWFDRVLVHGAIHTVEKRFDQGLCRGKKALLCVTTGASEAETSPAGKEGDVRMLLWPLAYTLRYLGFTVLQPQICHDVHGYHEGGRKRKLEDSLSTALRTHRKTIDEFDNLPVMLFNSDDDFDNDATLKADAISHSHFIRHN